MISEDNMKEINFNMSLTEGQITDIIKMFDEKLKDVEENPLTLEYVTNSHYLAILDVMLKAEYAAGKRKFEELLNDDKHN